VPELMAKKQVLGLLAAARLEQIEDEQAELIKIGGE
jgi:hypothetical protein